MKKQFLTLTLAIAILAAIPAALYSGKRGRESRLIRSAFYAFYPLHLLVLYAVRLVMG